MADKKERSTGKNLISFGAPGTGKSFSMKNHVKEIFDKNDVVITESDLNLLPERIAIRTTFHPDSDYSTFIGCYKPQQSVKDEDIITYKYTAQAFIKAYINAWCTTDPYFLIIEEINRGNCAQIFGDMFQILDRKPDGEHEYSISPDEDLKKYIHDAFVSVEKKPSDIPNDIKTGNLMYLPKNLTILATMNTSDQSLFPMDSAFKRRWQWKYVPIIPGKKSRMIAIGENKYSWWDFLVKVNQRVYDVTQSEDKKLGYWFVKVNDKEDIDADTFVSKVIFYLWGDVFKDYGKATGSPFAVNTEGENDTEKESLTFQSFYDEVGKVNLETIIKFLGDKGLKVLTYAPECDVYKETPNSKDAKCNMVFETSDELAKYHIAFPNIEKFVDVEDAKEILRSPDFRSSRDSNDNRQYYRTDTGTDKRYAIVRFPFRDDMPTSKPGLEFKELIAFIAKTIGKKILEFDLPKSGIKDHKIIEKNENIRKDVPKKPISEDFNGYSVVSKRNANDLVDIMYEILNMVTEKKDLFIISDAFNITTEEINEDNN